MKKRYLLLGIILVIVMSVPAFADTITLTFEGLAQQEQILDYYNGGYGGSGSGPGPNYGIIFGADSLALTSGNFDNNPTPPTIAFFMSGVGDVMNVPGGFNTGFSFYYASSGAAPVTVWDDLNGTGNLLTTINLPATPNFWYEWYTAGVTFAGTAKSVIFSGAANQIGFDNITLGSPNPVPVPPTVLLLGSGLVGLVGWRRFRKS